MNMLFAEMDSDEKSAAAYRVLARKYRPARFDDLIGQEALVRTLTNAIESGRLAQAYMLTGVRGVGKTTTARIIARSLNCTGVDGKGGPTIQPCGVCANCQAIALDRHVDVLEMDAASRTGVDDIRDIIDGVRYGPATARYKIYIIDEVHMLSKNAFNALLKTLEEPPPHTKFIFATTEIRKVPVTVLSRCQRFDLRRVEADVLRKHFTTIAAQENTACDDEALALIARAADGSVRDGLSLLDQAIARAQGHVTADDVKAMLGLADRARLMDLFQALHTGAIGDALTIAHDLRMMGADALVILHDLADIGHMLTRAKVAPELLASNALPEMERMLAGKLGTALGLPVLARTWQMLIKGMQEVQQAPDSHQALEMILIRLAYAADLPPPGDLIKQLQDNPPVQPAQPVPPPPSSGGSYRMQGHAALAVVASTPLPVTAAAPAVASAAMPEHFRALVQLFDEKREITLFSHLYSDVHLVKFEKGMLEVRPTPRAPANLLGKTSQLLHEWTGQRWIISASTAGGEETLAQQDKNAEKRRWQNAENHPLVRAVFQHFPQATITALRKKERAAEAAIDHNAGDDTAEILFTDD